LVSAFSTYCRDSEFLKLDYLRKDRKILVIRGGIHQFIMKSALLVGDVIILNEGDIIPADSIIINGRILVEDIDLSKSLISSWKSALKICRSNNIQESKIESNHSKLNIKRENPFLLSGSKVE